MSKETLYDINKCMLSAFSISFYYLLRFCYVEIKKCNIFFILINIFPFFYSYIIMNVCVY